MTFNGERVIVAQALVWQVGETEDAAVIPDVLAFAGIQPVADFGGAGIIAVREQPFPCRLS